MCPTSPRSSPQPAQATARPAAQAFALLYDELRRMARARLRPHQTMTLLDTTSLVHEAYLKLVARRRCRWTTGATSSPMPPR
jgi:DNA-directed RNA polymerase specialized sigma24 family protein